MSVRILRPLTTMVHWQQHQTTSEITRPGDLVADVFEPDALTITNAAGQVIAVYSPDQWLQVTVYGPSGYPDYCLQHSRYARCLEDRTSEILSRRVEHAS